MREILFRGKRVDNGEWVEGDFCHPSNICKESIGYDEQLKQSGVPIWEDYAVIPETVGQYTGLTDKNGKKIFEGDIVKVSGESEDYKCVDYHALIVYKRGGFCAIDGTEGNHSLRRYCLSTSDYSLKIIGNIHDNPELLK